jgi:hypothetical protein
VKGKNLPPALEYVRQLEDREKITIRS